VLHQRIVRWRKAWKGLKLGTRYIILTVIGFTMILPFLWMVSTSLKTKEGAVELPPRWIPRRDATVADIDGKKVPVSILKSVAAVKRLDTGATADVYAQAVHAGKPWWNPFADEKVTANIPLADGSGFERGVPVEVLSVTDTVRILDNGPRRLEVVERPGGAVKTESWVSLEWSNYPETWNKLPFGRSYVNTTIMSVTVTLGELLTSSLAAFAFARLRFPGRDKIFLGYLATMMIPGAVTLIPVYILFVKMPELLNWVFHTDWFAKDLYFMGTVYMGRLIGGNSYFALIVPGLFSAYGTFMLRQFFMNVPRELEDAARIDGCGNLRIYWHVTLPLSKVALATLGTFTFMGTWKAFMWPLLIINREELLPLQVLLQRFRGQYGAEFTLLMAGSIIVLVPLLIVFLFGQRYFVKGIQLGGVKG
jgi:multiple sugar transport system permease protein